jgi:argininosuccinate lyase
MSESKTKLWGARFEKGPAKEFFEFNRSFGFDYRLLEADIKGTLAHAHVLLSEGILNQTEVSRIRECLVSLQNNVVSEARLLNDPNVEDVHAFIEAHLTLKLGELGKKIHAGRSRNDQVATALRIWLIDESTETLQDLNTLLVSIANLAEDHKNVVIPGYTHLQRAQPVLWAHWCLAYAEMLLRDRSRLKDLEPRLKVLPLGSGALSGSSLARHRDEALKKLDFVELSSNSLDGVSDRDFVFDWQSFASILMIHLSRLAEDLILYASSEFGIIELGDEVSSGSSLMPQKKNPDALELIRGKSGRVIGRFMGFLTTVKGLPLAYNKDLQEDKEALFDTVDTLRGCLRNMTLVLRHTRPKDPSTLPLSLDEGYMNATDLADLCVRQGMPFREAHEKVGLLVRSALDAKLPLEKLPESTLEALLPGIGAKLRPELSLYRCLERKNGLGGTSPARVHTAIRALRQKI